MAIPRPFKIVRITEGGSRLNLSRHVSRAQAQRKINALLLADSYPGSQFIIEEPKPGSAEAKAVSKAAKPKVLKAKVKAKPARKAVRAVPARVSDPWSISLNWEELEVLSDLVKLGAQKLVFDNANDLDAVSALTALHSIGVKLRRHMFVTG